MFENVSDKVSCEVLSNGFWTLCVDPMDGWFVNDSPKVGSVGILNGL